MTERFEIPGRTNQVGHREERWRPPPLQQPTTLGGRLVASARRFLDLQAGSIWDDLARLLPRCHGVILDVGCGAQPYRGLVPPGADYKAIDQAVAADNFGYSSPGTIYYQGDRWPIDDTSVDFILCTETLEHVPEPAVFLAEAARCLRPGGRMILTVPFAARWHFVPHDYWRFTPPALHQLLSAAGFEEVAVYARGNAWTVAAYKDMALLLPLLMPQNMAPWKRLPMMACGVLTLPLLVALGAIGTLSLKLSKGADDCIGYTAVSRRAAINPRLELVSSEDRNPQ